MVYYLRGHGQFPEVITTATYLEERKRAIRWHLQGERPSVICARLGRSSSWFWKWWRRYVHWGPEGLEDQSRIPHRIARRTDPDVEAAILQLRRIKEARDRQETRYGLIGAPSIRRELHLLGFEPVPAISTIEGILQRHHLTHPKVKAQDPSTPREYPQPPVQNPDDLHQLDLYGPWYLKGQETKHYFYVIKDVASLAVWIDAFDTRQGQTIASFLVEAFQTFGLPHILQMDNAMEFQGSAQHPRSLSRVIRLCLYLGVEPLFIPQKQPWCNGSVENLIGQLEELFFQDQSFSSLQHIKEELPRFVHCCNTQHPHAPLNYRTAQEVRKEAPVRRLCKDFQLPDRPLAIQKGKVSFIRQIRKSGWITVLSEKFDIDPGLAGEYV